MSIFDCKIYPAVDVAKGAKSSNINPFGKSVLVIVFTCIIGGLFIAFSMFFAWLFNLSALIVGCFALDTLVIALLFFLESGKFDYIMDKRRE